MIKRLSLWAAQAALFVWAALRIDLPRFWVFCAIWCGGSLYGLLAADPTLIAERLKPGGPTADRWLLLGIRVTAVVSVILAVADLERNRSSSAVPPPVRIAAMAVFAASLALALRAMVANRFFSIAVRIQTDRGHHVVRQGPYGIVRHPGYLGMLTAMPAATLALGSSWAVGPALVYSALIGVRVRLEDRYLQEHLEGYKAYANDVRFRLIPGIW